MTDTQVHDVHAPAGHKTHPPDREYVFVALFLAIVTGAEVALFYINLEFTINAILLSALMVVKFATVAMFFMHLRFDSRVFRYFFVSGIVVAVSVYLIVLTTFHFWTGG